VLFQPSIHGWPFPDVLTLEPLPQKAGVASSDQEGLGAGMCWTALDRYLGEVRIRRDTAAPAPGDPLYAELLRRQAAAMCGLWPRVRDWQSLPDRALASRTRTTLRFVRRSLEGGQPVLLTLLPESDPYLRRRAARHVLATAWSRAGKQVTLSIYDPIRPDDNGARLSFSRSGTLDARLASGEVVRGFFPVPYDLRRPTPLHAETFADREVVSPARPVHGRIAARASSAGLDVVARSPDGTLLHFRRTRRARWRGVSVTEQEGIDRLEMHGDPAILTTRRALHAFARGYVGDLLHFRLSRKWSVWNRTENKRTGPRFRLAGRPVPLAGPWGQLHVFGRDKDNGIVHYERNLLRRWSAAQIAGDPIAGDPVAVRIGRTVHLLGVTADGRLLHWEQAATGWVPRDLTAGDRAAPTVPLAGAPVVVLRDEILHVVARDRENRLVHFRRAPDGNWRSIPHEVQITGDPAAMVGPAGVHVFGTGPQGQLIHRWGDVELRGEDIAATRPSLHLPGTPPPRLTGWATRSELNVMGRWGDQLITLTWRDDSDWVAIPLPARAGITDRHLPAEDPLVVTDSRGDAHLFGVDPEGSVIHMEPADSPRNRPPRIEAAMDATRSAATGSSAAPQAAVAVDATAAPPVDEPAAQPTLDAEPEGGEPEAAERPGELPPEPTRSEPVPWSSLERQPDPDAHVPLPEPQRPPIPEPLPTADRNDAEPWEMALTSELALSEAEAPQEVAQEAVETEAAVPEEIAPAPVQVEALVPQNEPQPEPVPEPAPVAADAEPPVSPEDAEEPEKPASRGVHFEPMDLTSLEMVPPPPSSRRRRQRKKA
jgi:hypothetical protein